MQRLNSSQGFVVKTVAVWAPRSSNLWGVGTKISRGTTFTMYRHSLQGVEANHMIMTLEKFACRHLSHPDGLSNEEEAYVRPLDIPVVTCGITYSVMFYHFNPTNQKNMDFNSGCFLMAFQFKQLLNIKQLNIFFIFCPSKRPTNSSRTSRKQQI